MISPSFLDLHVAALQDCRYEWRWGTAGTAEIRLCSFVSLLTVRGAIVLTSCVEVSEFRLLLQCCGFDFPEKQLDAIFETADVDHDGVLQYNEFIPVMLSMVLVTPNSKHFTPFCLLKYVAESKCSTVRYSF